MSTQRVEYVHLQPGLHICTRNILEAEKTLYGKEFRENSECMY